MTHVIFKLVSALTRVFINKEKKPAQKIGMNRRHHNLRKSASYCNTLTLELVKSVD